MVSAIACVLLLAVGLVQAGPKKVMQVNFGSECKSRATSDKSGLSLDSMTVFKVDKATQEVLDRVSSVTLKNETGVDFFGYGYKFSLPSNRGDFSTMIPNADEEIIYVIRVRTPCLGSHDNPMYYGFQPDTMHWDKTSTCTMAYDAPVHIDTVSLSFDNEKNKDVGVIGKINTDRCHVPYRWIGGHGIYRSRAVSDGLMWENMYYDPINLKHKAVFT